MILNRSFPQDPPIYLTLESLSYPPLFSSKLSVLSLSSNTERKHLVKRFNYDGQSPELEKGEVVLRKEISSLSKETLTLKSHEDECVRSDEITLKQQRDLGVFTNVVSGQQPSSSTAHRCVRGEMKKDGAILQTVLGTTSLMLNPESDKGGCIILGKRMKVSKIEDLRAAIYQTSESTGELRQIHSNLIELLMVAEQKLMKEFLANKWEFQTVVELLKQYDDEKVKV